MEQLQAIKEYIRTVKIKKAFFGGYDREDVYKKFADMIELFQHITNEMNEAQRGQIEMYEQRLETSDMLIKELNKKIGIMSMEQKNVNQEKEKMKEVYKEYCVNVLQQYSDSLRSLSSEFTQILENVTNIQKSILNVDLLEAFEDQIDALPEYTEDFKDILEDVSNDEVNE